MKRDSTNYLAVGCCALLKRIGIQFALVCALFWFAAPAGATNRSWTANSSQLWSDPHNWSPVGVPLPGENLDFYFTKFTSDPDPIVIDVTNVSVGTLTFSGEDGVDPVPVHIDWVVTGNTLTFTGGVVTGAGPDMDVNINCPIKLGHNSAFATSSHFFDTYKVLLNGPVDLNGHDLTINSFNTQDGFVEVSGVISGVGNVIALGVVKLDGPQGNTFQGSLISTYGSDGLGDVYLGYVELNKQSGVAVNDRVRIDSGGKVILNRSEQIGDNARVEIAFDAVDYLLPAKLLLNGYNETIGSLYLTNSISDTNAVLVDTGGGTLGLNGGITASSSSATVHPTILGYLNLNGFLPFNINGGPQPGLEILASISGNGFQKVGNGMLRLTGNNTFFGDAEISAGTVEAWTATAFGQAGPTFGVELDGSGSLVLQGVAIGAEPLFVNSVSSTLTAYNSCSWAGPVTLNTDFNVIPVDATFSGLKLNFTGGISGSGGLNLLPALLATGNVQLSGPKANTFTGPLAVNCQLLELNKPSGTNAFAGPLVVGNLGFAAEARWINSYQHQYVDVTVYTNGLVNLYTNHEDFETLTFNGGMVDGGSGELVIYGTTTVNPATSGAVINGHLGLPVVYPNNPFIVYDTPGLDCDLTVNAIIQDGGTLFKQGAGTMCLYGANTYTGVTIVDQGILFANDGNSLGIGTARILVNPNATLRLSPGFATLTKPIYMNGIGVSGSGGALAVVNGGTWTLTGGVSLDSPSTINVGTGAGLGINSLLSGNGPISKTGAGNLSLLGSVNNTYSGDTIVTEGYLYLAKNPNKISVPGNLVIGPASAISPAEAILNQNGGFAGAPVVTVNANSIFYLGSYSQVVSQLNLNDGGDVDTFTGVLSFPPDVDSVVNVGSQTTGSHNNSYISGNLALPVDGGVTFSVAPYSPNPPFANYPEFEIAAVISGPGDLANEGIYKTGQGQMQLSYNNTFAGFVQVNGGTLLAVKGGSLGTSANPVFVNNGASLALDSGIFVTNKSLYLTSSNSAALDSRSGSNTWSGPISLSQPSGISVSTAGGYLQALNTVSGAGSLTKLGPGRLQFWGFGPNTYGGGTTVAAGTLEAGRVSQVSIPGTVVIGDDTTHSNTATLQVDREQQFSSAANVNLHNSGKLHLNDNPTLGVPVPTIGTLSGGGIVYLGTNASLTVNNAALDVFAGSMSGPGAFNKTGSGLLQLTANNTYSGITTVSAGTLQVDGSQPQSAVQVSSGGRLQGLGTVGGINMSGNSSIVAPGDGTGILTCSNYNATGNLEIQLNGATPGTDYDQLNVRGAVAFGNKVNLNATLGFSSWLSNTFTIINNDGSDPVSGTFNGLAQGATLAIGSQTFQISYTGGDGNDVVLTQITGLPRPNLTIERASPGLVRLLWRTNSPTFSLQVSSNLAGPNWTPASPVPSILGTNFVVTNSATGAKFYRLSNP